MSGKTPGDSKPPDSQPTSEDKPELDDLLRVAYHQYLGQSPHPGHRSNIQNSQQGFAGNLNPLVGRSQPQAADAAGMLNYIQGFTQRGDARDMAITSSSIQAPIASSVQAAAASTADTHAPAPAAAAAKPDDIGSEDTKKPAEKSGKKGTPQVDEAFLEKQLNAIARASLLRAITVDINAPDPEQESPPNESPLEKRRRKERISGRRKRTKKLIEMDTLNDQLVSLAGYNKKLKHENAYFRRQIDEIKKLQGLPSGPDSAVSLSMAAKISEMLPQTNPAATGKQQAVNSRPENSENSTAKISSQALQLGDIQIPQRNLGQQHFLSAISSGFPALPNAPQGLTQPPNTALLSFLQSQQTPLQTPFPQLAHQLQLQQLQLLLQQNPQLTTSVLQSLTGSPSPLYAAAPPALQGHGNQSWNPSQQDQIRLNLLGQNPTSAVETTATAAAAREPAAGDRSSSPIPKNAKELTEWMKKQQKRRKRG